MLAIIFIRTGSRHNGGECGHTASVRRDRPGNNDGNGVSYVKKKLRLNLCNVNRSKRAKRAGSK